jgi:hypothetical protein
MWPKYTEELIMRKQLIVHVGTHKTGSTSLQRFLLDHVVGLSRKGIAVYRGEFREGNHIELHLAAMRCERDSFAKLGVCGHVVCDAEYTRQVAERVRDFVGSCDELRVVFTSEDLCWLRHDDEIDRLRTILDVGHHEAKVVLYLRNEEDFLRSYRAQIHKVPGRQPSNDPASTLYVEPDTWLVDYDSLVSAYQRGFGADNVVVIDYDDQMRKVGNVIPSFLSVLGPDSADELDCNSYFLNTTDPAEQRKPSRGFKRWLERAKRGWSLRKRRPAA